MAKKSDFNLSDDGFLQSLGGGVERPKKKTFDELSGQVGGVTSRQVAKVTGDKMMAGIYKRHQVLLPPAQISHVKQLAGKHGMSEQAFWRFLIDSSLAALEGGEIEPEVVEKVVRGEAVKRHWSSK